MASAHNIIKLTDFPRRKDPVIAARQAMSAACTDKAFDEAVERLSNERPVSAAGAAEQLAELRFLLEVQRAGDKVEADALLALLSGPEHFIGMLTRRVG